MEKPVIAREIRKIHQGRVFTLQVETVPLPDGREVKADVIRHPGSVVIVPVTDEGEIVLVRQYRVALGREAWELPAGSLEPGEDVREAVIRECHEEIGAIPSRLERLGAFFPVPGYSDEEMHFYRVSGLREPDDEDEPAEQDEDEDIEAEAFAVERIRQMIAEGEIVDLKTVAGCWLLENSQPPTGP